MSLVIAAMLLVSPTQIAGSASFAPAETTSPAELAGSEAVQSARKWLALVDEGRWNDSRDAAGQSFKSLNTSEEWASVSEGFRPPLGAVLSRTAVSEETVVAPPNGYRTIEFRTRFVNLPDARETVTLEREAGEWKVVGYMIDG